MEVEKRRGSCSDRTCGDRSSGRGWRANGSLALCPSRLSRHGHASIRESELICAEMHAREPQGSATPRRCVVEMVRCRTFRSAATYPGNWQSGRYRPRSAPSCAGVEPRADPKYRHSGPAGSGRRRRVKPPSCHSRAVRLGPLREHGGQNVPSSVRYRTYRTWKSCGGVARASAGRGLRLLALVRTLTGYQAVALARVFSSDSHALAHARKLEHLGLMLDQVHCRLTQAAIADARIVPHRFQRFPALAAGPVQAAVFNRNSQRDRSSNGLRALRRNEHQPAAMCGRAVCHIRSSAI